MKNTSVVLLLVLSFFMAITLWAQKKKEEKKSTTVATTKKNYAAFVPSYLGRSPYTGGPISKNTFDSLLKQGISAKDSLGNNYAIQGFRFNYAELNLYEDSVGNLVKMMDYLIEFCFGDTINTNISSSIYQRTKEGDTVFIDEVRLLKPDSGSAAGKPMKFTITK